MTGGLTYLSRADVNDYFNDDHLNRDSVRFATLEPQEEQWLRRILRRHMPLTGSRRAARLAQPTPSCRWCGLNLLTPALPDRDTWASTLARLDRRGSRAFGPDKLLTSERPRSCSNTVASPSTK